MDRTKSGVRMTGILSEVPLSGGLQVADAPFARQSGEREASLLGGAVRVCYGLSILTLRVPRGGPMFG
jgi:hypothetical protein